MNLGNFRVSRYGGGGSSASAGDYETRVRFQNYLADTAAFGRQTAVGLGMGRGFVSSKSSEPSRGPGHGILGAPQTSSQQERFGDPRDYNDDNSYRSNS